VLNDCLPVDSFEHELASAYVGYSGMLNVQWDQLRVIRLLMGRAAECNYFVSMCIIPKEISFAFVLDMRTCVRSFN
jgi:hypothetical protein